MKFVNDNKNALRFTLLVIVILVFWILNLNRFTRLDYMLEMIVVSYADTMVLTLGMIMVVRTGNIDLSAGAVCLFISVLAKFLYAMGVGILPILLVTVVVGACIGSILGYLVAYKLVPSVIVTLSCAVIMVQVSRGLSYISRGIHNSINYNHVIYQDIQDYIPGYRNDESIILIMLFVFLVFIFIDQYGLKKSIEKGIQVDQRLKYTNRYFAILIIDLLLSWLFYSEHGIPINVFIVVILVLIVDYVLNYTIFGKNIYRIGDNKVATDLSGVDVKKTVFNVYVIMGVFAAIAGIIGMGLGNSTSNEINALSASYFGAGSVAGSVIIGYILAVINFGPHLMDIKLSWYSIIHIIEALILLFAASYHFKKK